MITYIWEISKLSIIRISMFHNFNYNSCSYVFWESRLSLQLPLSEFYATLHHKEVEVMKTIMERLEL